MKHLITTLAILLMAIGAHAADTLTIATQTSTLTAPLQDGTLECNIVAQVPVNGNATLQATLNDRVNKRVAQMLESIKGEESTLPLLNSIERALIKAVPRFNAISGRHHISLDATLTRVYETSQIITFRLDLEYYGTDKQRHLTIDHITIVKQNGKALQWNDVVVKKQQGKFCKTLATVMQTYFGVKDFNNLKAQLKNGDKLTPETFPLPSDYVAVTRDGLCFAYNAGEIADPDKGMPFCTISLSSVWGCLTPNAKKLLK